MSFMVVAGGALIGGIAGSQDKTSTANQNSTTTNTMYQQEYFDKLLSGADKWLEDGGLGNAVSYFGDMNQILGQMGQGYMDMASGAGKEDRYNALQDLNKASAAQAANALGGELNTIGLGAAGTGTSNSSRRGVAEGVATAQANTALSAQQAAQNQAFLQNEQALQQQGIQGMGNLFNMTGQMHGMAQGETAGAKQLQNLLAYQALISGNMGGTSTTTGTSSQTQEGDFLSGALSGAMAGFSDKKLKKKIKKVYTKDGKKVKTKDGIDLAEWEWTKDAERKYDLKGKAKGVIAQEAEKKRPDAVKKNKAGDRMVNYAALM